MRRLLVWALLALATVLLASPAAAQLPVCSVAANPFVQTGGASYQVVSDNQLVSTHATLHAALGRMSVLQHASPAAVVRVTLSAEWRTACLMGGVVIPPPPPPAPPPPPPPPAPPPPPPPPADPWVLTLVSKTLMADTTRILVQVRLSRQDGSRVAGAMVRWEVVGTAGGFTAAMVPTVTFPTNAQGESTEGWRTVAGVVNQIRLKSDSSTWLHVTHGTAAPPAPPTVSRYRTTWDRTTLAVGEIATVCLLVEFTDGVQVLRSQNQTAHCQAAHATLPAAVRAVTPAHQALADALSPCVEATGGTVVGLPVCPPQ